MAGMAAGGGEVAGLVNGQMNDAMLNIVKDMVVEQTSNTLLAEEERLDGMMKKLDNLDEDTLERMREARKRRMQKQADERHKLKQKGHGTYTEISGDKEFFAALKDCPRRSHSLLPVWERTLRYYGQAHEYPREEIY